MMILNVNPFERKIKQNKKTKHHRAHISTSNMNVYFDV